MQIEISPKYRCLANEQTIYKQLLSQLVLTKILSLKRGEFFLNISLSRQGFFSRGFTTAALNEAGKYR